ncbi:N-acetyl-alpha-D-glucosaminyl L-malate synthase BshA [Listeria fleischmannii subsp. fleischmannii]|uniref:N-acetyl-alpha-D-glucosaminyl L-malate synthase BshA n=2 Tax=Listeria fleischmannii TaxID=1069827 RepID=A0A2X3HL31_9LIST|nr:N-acetyl-alpha-D-glucosaminyl L-malate synthase BshA [Listeria fleischmannii subsp. fleischmannii]
MACGIPVIGSQIAGIKGYLVEGENGYFTEVGNPYSIAEKLLEFAVSSKENKKRLSDNAFHSAAPYDEECVKNRWFLFYRVFQAEKPCSVSKDRDIYHTRNKVEKSTLQKSNF